MKYLRRFFVTSVILSSALMAEPNPPSWPASVTVFDPGQSAVTINGIVDAAYATNGGQTPCNNGQFTTNRYAFLFKPGIYATGVSIPVGFYTSVIGLGQEPSDTQIPDVFCEQGCAAPDSGALDTFWRSAENFATTPTRLNGVMQWAVSQAAPLRRIQLPAPGIPPAGGLFGIQLWENQNGGDGFASGGFMGDCNIASSPTTLLNVSSGPQQQWMSRNCQMNWSDEGVWNFVFVGCTGKIPPTTVQKLGYFRPVNTNIAATPVIAEKPYIKFAGGFYFLEIPPLEFEKTGPTTDFTTNVTSVDFANVYVVQDPANETAGNINDKINMGLHIILTPGIYGNLNGPIQVKKSVTILGIGFPTLIAKNGQPCIQVLDGVRGVRIGGILLQAGSDPSHPSPVLLQMGQTRVTGGNANFLYDIFARVGGPADPSVNPVAAKTMVEINQDNVIIDNAWLWRADHWSVVNGVDNPVKNGDNPCDTGLLVNGDNAITYGLAVEHTLKDLVVWHGENGRAFFYQAEYPYDVTQAYGNSGFAAYRTTAQKHTAYGLGVYSFFRDFPVNMPSGIATMVPVPAGNSFTNVLTKYLTGNGGIKHVINTTGNIVQAGPDAGTTPSYVPFYPGSSPFYPRNVRRSTP